MPHVCSGIGIVNAIEVLNAFPEEDGLLKFREWVESPDPTILGRLDAKSGSNTRKKLSKVEEKINSLNCDDKESTSEQNLPRAPEQNELPDCIQETKKTFFNKHVIDFQLFVLSIKIMKCSFAFIRSCLFVTFFFSFNREMLARIGTFLLLFQVKQLYLLTVLHTLINQLSLSHGGSQTILFFGSEFIC